MSDAGMFDTDEDTSEIFAELNAYQPNPEKRARLMKTMEFVFTRDQSVPMTPAQQVILEHEANEIVQMLDEEKEYFENKYGFYPLNSFDNDHAISKVMQQFGENSIQENNIGEQASIQSNKAEESTPEDNN